MRNLNFSLIGLILFSLGNPLWAANRSDEYKQTVEQIKNNLGSNTLKLQQRYKGIQILLVRGYSPTTLSAPSPTPQYFDDQVALLKQLGIDYQLSDILPSASIEVNSAKLSAAIQASDGPVFIVAHSKGGLDTLDALIRLVDDESLTKVAGFLAIQTPFAGVPLIDQMDSIGMGEYFRQMISRIGGDPATIDEMSEKTRKAYLLTHASAIAKLVTKIPMMTWSSYKSNDPERVDTAFEGTRNLMLKLGWKNDGLVADDWAKLPTVDYVVLEEASHIMPVLAYPKEDPYDRSLFSRAILTLAP